MSITSVRLDDGLKTEAQAKLAALGLSLNSYVVMAVKQLVIQNRVPFESTLPAESYKPNDETRKAMIRSMAWAEGLLPDETPTFSSSEELFAALDREESQCSLSFTIQLPNQIFQGQHGNIYREEVCLRDLLVGESLLFG